MHSGQRPPGGLFIQVVDWMLVPMVVLWPAIVIGAYFVTMALTDAPFDRELEELLLIVAEDARRPPRGIPGDGDYPALKALRAMPGDQTMVRISTEAGKILAGDSALPFLRPPGPVEPNAVRFRDARVDGEEVRIAYLTMGPASPGRAWLVQVGEPLSRRRALASEATNVVMVVTVSLVPLMVGLVWFGLHRGLRPLRDLSARIRARDATDMSPIPPEDAPEELAPLLESLNEQLGRVRANLESQRRFVGDAAHQLRTPLAGLKTQAQIAVREWPAPSVRDRLERIEQSAARMGHLVTQLLALARADDLRTRDAAFEPVDLDALLRDVCTQLADEAIARRMTIAFEPSNAVARADGSPMLLRELFGNLVDNAIRYGPAGGEITVRVSAGAACEVAVEDNGPGIPPAERELVFARFYRVLGTGEVGSGLGLAIVKEIAGQHRAAIRIEAPPAGGTRFVVAFPPPGKP